MMFKILIHNQKKRKNEALTTSVFLQECYIGTLSRRQATGFLSVGAVEAVCVPVLSPVHVTVGGSESVGWARVGAEGRGGGGEGGHSMA